METYDGLTDREKEKYLDNVVFKGWERDFQTLHEYMVYLDLWLSTRPVRHTKKSWYKFDELLRYTEAKVNQEDLEALVKRGVIKVKKVRGWQYVWFMPINMLLMEKKEPKPKRTCVVCGGELPEGRRKYCSEKCHQTGQGLKPKRTTCQKCGGPLPRGRYKFCYKCNPAPNTCQKCGNPCFGRLCKVCLHKGEET